MSTKAHQVNGLPKISDNDRANGSGLPYSSSTFNTREKVQGKHANELVRLALTHRKADLQWLSTIRTYVTAYIRILSDTWSNVTIASIHVLTGKLEFKVLLSYLLFTTGVSVLLFFALFWCIFAHNPIVYSLYTFYSKKRAGHRGLVNLIYDMFKDISVEQANAGKRSLSRGTIAFDMERREFDLDAAKLLLQLSSLMYERAPVSARRAVKEAQKSMDSFEIDEEDILKAPSTFLKTVLGQRTAEAAIDSEDSDNLILQFTRSFNVEYLVCSELNTLSSAYCALFYDPNSNWIVVAFKGTSPTEYDEWVTDLDIIMENASHYIPGFSKVHGGFLERLFPTITPMGKQTPYDTIVEGVTEIAKELLSKLPPTDNVNVYYTGHSLGSALASIAYAKALSRVEPFGPRVLIRDAYVFACPVSCNINSSAAFNAKACDQTAFQRTLWRITNMNDIVATGLPDLGDDPRFRRMVGEKDADGDLFLFAHLGTELKMKTKPDSCRIKSVQFESGTQVIIRSSMDFHSVGAVKPGTGLSKFVLSWQYIPLIGRIVQHGTGFYWDQLQRVGKGECEWMK